MYKLKFVPGARPGKRVAPSKPNLKRKEPDTTADSEARPKTSRKFVETWKVGRPWLSYNADSNTMQCTYCKKYEDEILTNTKMRQFTKETSMIDGSANFRKSVITDHEVSKYHMKATDLHDAERQQVSATVGQSAAGKALIQLKEKERNHLRLKFRNVHALCKHNRPLSDYSWMTDLDEAKGYEVGSTYRNNQAGSVFMDYIADIEQENVVKTIKDSNFFSITMDGSTDIGTVEQEILYVRTVLKGEITSKFLKIDEPESTSSQNLYNVVKATIHDLGLIASMGKLVGFGCDGASNMLGCKKGLAKLLKDDYPSTVVIHCLAHRLELAFKDAVKQSASKPYDRVVTLLIGLYYFYKKSSKQRKSLRRAFAALNIKSRMPPRVGGTRWLGHMARAIEYCLYAYPVLVGHLSDESNSNAKAEGLVKLLLNYETMAFILLLRVNSVVFLLSYLKVSLVFFRKYTLQRKSSTKIYKNVQLSQKFKTIGRHYRHLSEVVNPFY